MLSEVETSIVSMLTSDLSILVQILHFVQNDKRTYYFTTQF